MCFRNAYTINVIPVRPIRILPLVDICFGFVTLFVFVAASNSASMDDMIWGFFVILVVKLWL